LLKSDLNVDDIYTDKTTYLRGESVTVYFTATYENGSAVTTGSAPITVTMANGTTTQVIATYVSANSRFEAEYTLTSGDPLGTWYAQLAAQALQDNENNVGPDGVKTASFTVVAPKPKTVTVKITPQSLNMKSNGRYVMAHIELPEGYNAEDVDASTIRLDGVVAPEEVQVGEEGQLVVKFSRNAVKSYIQSTIGSTGSKFTDINLTVTGEIAGNAFESSDTIRVKR
jgi:hypothetical protein